MTGHVCPEGFVLPLSDRQNMHADESLTGEADSSVRAVPLMAEQPTLSDQRA
jgi:hypothetical protein